MQGTGQKRQPRVQTRIAATLLTEDDAEMPVEVMDLSGGGFRLRSRGQLEPGQQIRLRVSRYGDFPAQIQWAEGEEAGGIFKEPVTL